MKIEVKNSLQNVKVNVEQNKDDTIVISLYEIGKTRLSDAKPGEVVKIGDREWVVLEQRSEGTKLLLLLLDYFVKVSKNDGSVYTLSKLDIDGKDLITLGYRGKQIGDILNYLLDMVMRGGIVNKKQELIWLVSKMELE